MTSFEFYNLVFENYILYSLLLIFVTFFFYITFRKYVNTFFDPLILTFTSIVFTTVVPFFLYFVGEINLELTLYFTFAQLAFWGAFLIPAKKEITFSRFLITDEKKVAYILYILLLIIYLILTIVSYSVLGIPLFKESRLEVYSGSGLGLFARIMPFAQFYCIFYSFYFWENEKKTFFSKALVVLSFFIFLITGILSGSRASFFVFIFVYWGYSIFFLKDTKKINKLYKYLIIGFVITLFSFVVKSNDYDILTGLSSFWLRAISSGDNYYMALPNDVWKNVITGPWFSHFFLGLLGPLRIIDAASIPPPIGYQLVWAVSPSLDGIATGPLSSPALLGLLYFNWGGVVFSFLMGYFVSICMYRLPNFMPFGLLSSIFTAYFYMQMLSFIQDSCLGMSYLFDSVFNLVFMLVLIIGIVFFTKKKFI